MKLRPTHWIAIALAGIAGLDLATGDSNEPILPAAIGNVLTQQLDFVLLAVAALLFFFT